MACVGHIRMASPLFEKHTLPCESPPNLPSDFPIAPCPRARRPALIPPNASLTLAEAEELIRTRIHQPLFPPPDPELIDRLKCHPAGTPSPISADPGSPNPASHLDQLQPCSWPQDNPNDPLLKYTNDKPPVDYSQNYSTAASPSPKSTFTTDASPIPPRPPHPLRYNRPTPYTFPPVLPTPPREREPHAKARKISAQSASPLHPPAEPSTLVRSLPEPHTAPTVAPKSTTTRTSTPRASTPKRKHSAFLIDEELKCQREDVVGTPHLSEVVPGDEETTPLDIEELNLGEPVMMNPGVRGWGAGRW